VIDEILFTRQGGIGRVTLNRPRALNALTADMALEFDETLVDWAADDGVAAVVIAGAGERAFCAGGDIRALYAALERPGDPLPRDFYWHEYRLNHRIHAFAKPYVALVDGVVMGGGVGVSIHGSHRVLTERSLFAMPETGIGLFPDVGMTHVLPRMPGRLGLYLGLTGARLRAADALYCGVGTHYAPSARLDDLVTALAADPGDVDAIVAGFATDPGPPPLAAHRPLIDRCFAGESVEAILASLAAEPGDWAAETLATLRSKSPASLKVTHRQITRGAGLDFAACMRLEFRLSQHFCAGHDFAEGIRAVVIDKDGAPKWKPARLAEVSDADVEAYFAPLPEGELAL